MTEQPKIRGRIIVHHTALQRMALPFKEPLKADQSFNLIAHSDENTQCYFGSLIALAQNGYEVCFPDSIGVYVNSFPDGDDMTALLFAQSTTPFRGPAFSSMKRFYTAVTRNHYNGMRTLETPPESTHVSARKIRTLLDIKKEYNAVSRRDPLRDRKYNGFLPRMRANLLGVQDDLHYDTNVLCDIVRHMPDDGAPVFILTDDGVSTNQLLEANKQRKLPLKLGVVSSRGFYEALGSHQLLQSVGGVNPLSAHEIITGMDVQRDAMLVSMGSHAGRAYSVPNLDHALIDSSVHDRPFAASLVGLKEELEFKTFPNETPTYHRAANPAHPRIAAFQARLEAGAKKRATRNGIE